MSSAITPLTVTTSPTSESSSTSSNATPSSIQPHEKPGFPPPMLPSQLNDNYDINLLTKTKTSSISMIDNKENKDDLNTKNNNKHYSNVMNSNNSSTSTIVGSSNASTTKGLSNTSGVPTADETRRSCNRCQNCSGFSSHEWRNTCTSCRCPRSCHDVSIGARCCGFHRAGFDPSSTLSSGQTAIQLQKNNSISTIPVSTPSSQNQTIQPPPLPLGNAPGIENGNPSSTINNPAKTNPNSLSCNRTITAEGAGYSWMPQVG